MKTNHNSFILILLVILMAGHSMEAQILKSWSPQAKGTAIGAGTGAAAGAIINKRNRVVGGVIGGVVGGAAGYAVGKHIDNKRKKAAWQEAGRRAAEQQPLATSKGAAPSITKRTALAARPAVSATKPTFSAVQPVQKSETENNPALYVLNQGYLPNPYYGDQTAPYGATEYRQKSW
ncbi:glycine zipper domain-containing protein [Larkinella humicola]|uniref:Glycine zipper domain-containing protein n=1 Tax=Larkinella humicola TaxID=2607654 RepID=A0A5N1J981_9BACT|nr:YMGG-like glycine zipper-containing protein [Larkinella humicola]KAA9349011.1 hypothetical protein F0P93_21640 [Larkinella humicola]